MKREVLRTRRLLSTLHANQSSSCVVAATGFRLEQNHALGLWVAYVRRDGEALAVIMESDRDDAIASAQAPESAPELLAA